MAIKGVASLVAITRGADPATMDAVVNMADGERPALA